MSEFTAMEIEILKNVNVCDLANHLQYGLVDGCWLHEEESVLTYLKKYFFEDHKPHIQEENVGDC